jgi:outer membrane protein assembly factor BamE (lipoprotein component of BamABCDE complex)
MPPQESSLERTAVTALMILPVVLIFGSAWVKDGTAVPEAKLSQLYKGMPEAEVRDLLGVPDKVYERDGGRRTWVYRGWFARCLVVADPRWRYTAR